MILKLGFSSTPFGSNNNIDESARRRAPDDVGNPVAFNLELSQFGQIQHTELQSTGLNSWTLNNVNGLQVLAAPPRGQNGGSGQPFAAAEVELCNGAARDDHGAEVLVKQHLIVR